MKAGPPVERSRTHAALASVSRVRLLDTLRRSEHPMDVVELAAASGLHVSTVRFHLKILTEAGLVRSQPDQNGTRGRPRLRYTPASLGATAAVEHELPGYRFLAAALAEHWADTPDQRALRAERAGRALAGRHGFATPSSGPPTAEHVALQLNGLFAELGFEPELAAEDGSLQIRLHACPFRAVAEQHPEVVCSLHLGLIRGALEKSGSPSTAVSLQPFVRPHLCIAYITPTKQG